MLQFRGEVKVGLKFININTYRDLQTIAYSARRSMTQRRNTATATNSRQRNQSVNQSINQSLFQAHDP